MHAAQAIEGRTSDFLQERKEKKESEQATDFHRSEKSVEIELEPFKRTTQDVVAIDSKASPPSDFKSAVAQEAALERYKAHNFQDMVRAIELLNFAWFEVLIGGADYFREVQQYQQGFRLAQLEVRLAEYRHALFVTLLQYVQGELYERIDYKILAATRPTLEATDRSRLPAYHEFCSNYQKVLTTEGPYKAHEVFKDQLREYQLLLASHVQPIAQNIEIDPAKLNEQKERIRAKFDETVNVLKEQLQSELKTNPDISLFDSFLVESKGGSLREEDIASRYVDAVVDHFEVQLRKIIAEFFKLDAWQRFSGKPESLWDFWYESASLNSNLYKLSCLADAIGIRVKDHEAIVAQKRHDQETRRKEHGKRLELIRKRLDDNTKAWHKRDYPRLYDVSLERDTFLVDVLQSGIHACSLMNFRDKQQNSLMHRALKRYAELKSSPDSKQAPLTELEGIIKLLLKRNCSPFLRNAAGQQAFEYGGITGKELSWDLMMFLIEHIPTYTQFGERVKHLLMKFCLDCQKSMDTFFGPTKEQNIERLNRAIQLSETFFLSQSLLGEQDFDRLFGELLDSHTLREMSIGEDFKALCAMKSSMIHIPQSIRGLQYRVRASEAHLAQVAELTQKLALKDVVIEEKDKKVTEIEEKYRQTEEKYHEEKSRREAAELKSQAMQEQIDQEKRERLKAQEQAKKEMEELTLKLKAQHEQTEEREKKRIQETEEREKKRIQEIEEREKKIIQEIEERDKKRIQEIEERDKKLQAIEAMLLQNIQSLPAEESDSDKDQKKNVENRFQSVPNHTPALFPLPRVGTDLSASAPTSSTPSLSVASDSNGGN